MTDTCSRPCSHKSLVQRSFSPFTPSLIQVLSNLKKNMRSDSPIHASGSHETRHCTIIYCTGLRSSWKILLRGHQDSSPWRNRNNFLLKKRPWRWFELHHRFTYCRKTVQCKYRLLFTQLAPPTTKPQALSPTPFSVWLMVLQICECVRNVDSGVCYQTVTRGSVALTKPRCTGNSALEYSVCLNRTLVCSPAQCGSLDTHKRVCVTWSRSAFKWTLMRK